MSSGTEFKLPRRSTVSVSSRNQCSTRFSHDEEVGGEVPVEPLVPGQPPLHVGVLGGSVDPELTLLAASSGTNTVHILGCARSRIP
jgi:hypothetical protein